MFPPEIRRNAGICDKRRRVVDDNNRLTQRQGLVPLRLIFWPGNQTYSTKRQIASPTIRPPPQSDLVVFSFNFNYRYASMYMHHRRPSRAQCAARGAGEWCTNHGLAGPRSQDSRIGANAAMSKPIYRNIMPVRGLARSSVLPISLRQLTPSGPRFGTMQRPASGWPDTSPPRRTMCSKTAT